MHHRTPPSNQSDEQFLQQRVDYLESMERWHLQEFEVLSGISQVQENIKDCEDRKVLLHKSAPYLDRIPEILRYGFCLINETTAEFSLDWVNREESKYPLQCVMDTMIESGDFGWASKSDRIQIQTALGCPIVLVRIAVPDKVLGIFIGEVSSSKAFKKHYQRLLEAALQHIAYALHSQQLYQQINVQNSYLENLIDEKTQQLEYVNNYDLLTNLPSKPSFKKHLELALARASRTGDNVTLILLDLDFFKRVNEGLGHANGDELLKQVASRLSKNLRETDPISRLTSGNQQDLVCHYGGDEFCLLISDNDQGDDTLQIINRLRKSLSRPFHIANREITQSFSAGIACFPEHSVNAEQLIQHADIALYQAKEQGRGRDLVYNHEMQEESLSSLTISSKLHQAIEKEEFELYYQPQIDMETNAVVGLEALIRWQGSDGNWIPPDHFIPLAEESGLIVPIGDWVIHQVCKQANHLLNSGFHIPIAINISARQFSQPDFIKRLLANIEYYDVPHHLLELELTERVIMTDIEETTETLKELEKLGIKVSVDDFGTGYSSLSYLKKFPIDVIKIDRAFVSDVTSNSEDAAIVSAIIAMASSLGLDTVAEGVETKEQMDFLRNKHCTIGQGYFFSQALSSADLNRYLKKQTGDLATG
ncbi:MAG: bifunctional diguanylate cyclase/phosphodiesterase [Pseudomonadales bacterium]|nr:bifunctional diguanylate cyclase/phosphodiesterase [Pseudomonadales bacterium]